MQKKKQKKENKAGYAPLAYNFVKNEMKMESCYCNENTNNKEPEFTTIKQRESNIEKHVIDYIFHNFNNQCKIAALLSIPDCNTNSQNPQNYVFLPSWNYPSDHFSIAAKLQFF